VLILFDRFAHGSKTEPLLGRMKLSVRRCGCAV
jgi:hypothetical protein